MLNVLACLWFILAALNAICYTSCQSLHQAKLWGRFEKHLLHVCLSRSHSLRQSMSRISCLGGTALHFTSNITTAVVAKYMHDKETACRLPSSLLAL